VKLKLKRARLAPALIAAGVIVLVCLLRLSNPGIFEWPEPRTYDLRAQNALRFTPPAATNLGFVYINDQTIRELRNGLLGKSLGLHWPRWVYGEVLTELAAQQATVVGLDVVFEGRRPDHDAVPVLLLKWPEARAFVSSLNEGEPVVYSNTGPDDWPSRDPMSQQNREETVPESDGEILLMESDHYFTWRLHNTDIAVLAAEKGVQPDSLFATNALATADISAHRDSDGVLRRARARVIRPPEPVSINRMTSA
jgi:hypothetical protein